jgi:putative tricarboxylic transport membrane protein
MVQSRAWRDALARYRWLDRYLPGVAFAEYSDAEEARVRRILRQLGTENGSAGALSSAGPYPVFVIAGLVLSALASAASRRSPRDAVAKRRAGRRPIAFILAGLVLHVALAERAGFIIASAILFWLTARAFDEHHPWRDGLFAIALSVGAYLLFARALDLTLPAGVLERWL